MDRIIARGRGIDRQPDLPIRIGLREMLGVVGRQVGLRAEIPVEVGRAEILGEMREGIDHQEILAEIVREGTQEAHREEGMLGIVLEILEGLRLAIRAGIGLVVGMLELGLAGLRLETPVGIVRAEIPAGMREGADLQPTTRVLRVILMRDFRREAIGHKGNHDRSHSHNRGHNLSLSSDLSRGRRRRVHDRVGSVGITMPEQRGRRAIAVEPVPVVVAETGEVGTNETSQS